MWQSKSVNKPVLSSLIPPHFLKQQNFAQPEEVLPSEENCVCASSRRASTPQWFCVLSQEKSSS